MSALAELDMDRQMIQSIAPGIGHNRPPEPTVLERAEECAVALSNFLNETPVIETGPQCVTAKQLVERVRGAAAELEAERTEMVRPLNEQVSEINAKYKYFHNADAKKPGVLDRIAAELKARLTIHAKREEAERAKLAEQARIAAEAAEAKAREAEAAEQRAKMDAAVGVVDTGVGEKIAAADAAFKEYETASRFAARAERDVAFRVGGQGKTLAMRTEKTLVLESYSRAIKAIGPNPKIEAAILSAARDYRKLNDKLPDGVTEHTERKF